MYEMSLFRLDAVCVNDKGYCFQTFENTIRYKTIIAIMMHAISKSDLVISWYLKVSNMVPSTSPAQAVSPLPRWLFPNNAHLPSYWNGAVGISQFSENSWSVILLLLIPWSTSSPWNTQLPDKKIKNTGQVMN